MGLNEEWNDVVGGFGAGDDCSRRVLDDLKSLNEPLKFCLLVDLILDVQIMIRCDILCG